ncbi:DUF3006 domain-containing protein [Heyndrickxia vini]|uniref:DUF3006 domain-containing protein n=1 Tax=Heyndrickxia vini TaxID=1476025 RepID=A0ABX7E4Q9_9BACI|nr:DUF3006 domain-containing protein [Heyndrickxia vini]QQZ10199.1 DUF3006 domain-containing protein [Heyndrickxia vini]
MKYIIDRFEDEIAVCETEKGTMIDIKKSALPSNVQTGDVLTVVDGHFQIDHKSTQNKKKEITKLMNEIWDD